MSVQPALALAEAVALSEMQMAAFEGGTLGTSINPGVYLPAKKRKAVEPLFVGCFIFIVLRGCVFFIHCPHATGFGWTLQRIRIYQYRHKGKEMT